MDSKGTGWKRLLMTLLPFLLLAGAIGYLLWKVGPSRIADGMTMLPPVYIALAFAFLCFDISADSMRYWATAATLGSRMPVVLGLKVCLVNLFVAFATPGAGGAAPAVAWMLTQRGYDEARGLSIGLIKGLLGYYFLVPLAAVLAIFAPGDVFNSNIVRVALVSGCLGLAFMLSLVTVIAIWPKIMARAVGWSLSGIRNRVKGGETGGKRDRLRRFILWLDNLLQNTSHDLGRFLRGPKRYVFAAFAFTLLNLVVLMSIAYILGNGFGLAEGKTQTDLAVICMLYVVLVFVAPTPGGAGIAEIGGEFMFTPILGDSGQAVALTLIWRTFTCYIPFILGAIVFSREVAMVGKHEQIDTIRPYPPGKNRPPQP